MGSYVHAKSLHDKKADVIGLINYEMIGYFSDGPHSQLYTSPALMINDTSFLRNPNDHETPDTIDSLDFPKMTEVVSSTLKAVCGMGGGGEGAFELIII